MTIKPINYTSPLNSTEPTFYLGMCAVPKIYSYIYLGIPFTDDLLLNHIIKYLYSKVKKSLFSMSHFFSNKHIPIVLKKKFSSYTLLVKLSTFHLFLAQIKLEPVDFNPWLILVFTGVLVPSIIKNRSIIPTARLINLATIQLWVFMPYLKTLKFLP